MCTVVQPNSYTVTPAAQRTMHLHDAIDNFMGVIIIVHKQTQSLLSPRAPSLLSAS